MRSRRLNHKDYFSVITGFDAFCKYYSQKMFWWEGELRVSVPSAWLFLGLKVWGYILVPLTGYWEIPAVSTGPGLYRLCERNGKSEMSVDICLLSCIHSITYTCSTTASGSLVNQKKFLKKLKHFLQFMFFFCPAVLQISSTMGRQSLV